MVELIAKFLNFLIFMSSPGFLTRRWLQNASEINFFGFICRAILSTRCYPMKCFVISTYEMWYAKNVVKALDENFNYN